MKSALFWSRAASGTRAACGSIACPPDGLGNSEAALMNYLWRSPLRHTDEAEVWTPTAS